jgi:hypothetical protein
MFSFSSIFTIGTVVPVREFEDPIVSVDDAPAAHIYTADANLIGIRLALNESSRLNKLAARWTGISALLGAAATVVGLIH